MAQALTAAQQTQARSNIGVQKKNYILNGAMMVSQENGATAGTASSYYPVDNIYTGISGTSGVVSAQQIASVTPAGSPNRLRMTVTTADAAVAAADIVWLEDRIEGLRVADLCYGSAIAKTAILQFGVKAPAGTYTVSVTNGALNRCYVAEYVIAAGEANTDVVKSVVIPGDTTGTWLKDNGIGLDVRWGLMVGTTYQQAAGSWQATNMLGSPNQFNFMGTVNNVFELFDVSLTEGSVAPPFVVPDYASELVACQRYYEKASAGDWAPLGVGHATSATTGQIVLFFNTTKRTLPNLSFGAPSDYALTLAAPGTATVTSFTLGGVGLSSAYVVANVAAGLTLGCGTELYRNASAPAPLAFDARL
jgi:hypothetical protein